MEENKKYKTSSFDKRNSRHDLSVARTPARIAVYDNLKAPPHIIKINPDITNNYIEKLSSTVYDEANKKGGSIPYTVIREICENFIHAHFSEIVVSILDGGNTIRFTDQGPGFIDINNAQLPGFTSATEDMKQYIRGVGSGLPTVKDYLTYSDGNIKIENNLENGAVVTISVLENLKTSYAFSDKDKNDSNNKYIDKLNSLSPNLSEREIQILKLILTEGALGITELHKITSYPLSSIYKILKDLEDFSLIETLPNKKRTLSDFGFNVINNFYN